MSKTILLLADDSHPADAIRDHIAALQSYPGYQWLVVNPLKNKLLHQLDWQQFAAVAVHFSIRVHDPYYVPKKLYQCIKRFERFKFIFLQDEHRYVNETAQAISDLNIGLMLTVLPQSQYAKGYPSLTHIPKVTLLAGYASDHLKNIPSAPIAKRITDIFYRSRKMPFWLGELAYDKTLICEKVKTCHALSHLEIDVSVNEADRIYGQAWIDALCDARCVLTTETGTSIWDFGDEAQLACKQYLRQHPQASFYEVQNAALKPFEGNVKYISLSPRIFETAAAKAVILHFPGTYDHALRPGYNSILLQRDFSNIEEVLAQIEDHDYLQQLADQAYHDLIKSDRYAQSVLAQQVANALQAYMPAYASPANITAPKSTKSLWNLLLCFKAELLFSLKQLTLLLRDPQYTLYKKVANIIAGAKRYGLYLSKRLITHKSH